MRSSNANSAVADAAATQVTVTADTLTVDLVDGRTLSVPLVWYPRLHHASPAERARWAAAVIAGEKVCNSPGFGNAGDAVRLKDFVSKAGKNGTFSSICEGDLTKGLSAALATFDAACRNFPPATK